MATLSSLEEVARRAGVSTATASRVLNNLSVRSKNRARVLRAVEELGYQPNLYARDLAGGKSRTIGVIVSNMQNPFFLDIFRTVETVARTHGFEVLAANTGYSPEQLVRSVRLMIGRRVTGVAAITAEMDPALIDEFARSHIPAVLFEGAGPRSKIANIRVNYHRGTAKIVNYLHSMGHRRLGFLGHPATLREGAVQNAAAQRDMEIRIATGEDSLEGGRQSVAALLNTGFMPTAVLCVNDIVAFGALRELRERGIRVPEDMSVVGFDNVNLSEFSFPALTTVHVPRERIGQIVCDYLIPVTGEVAQEGFEVVIETDLVLRESTGPAAGMTMLSS